MCLLCESYFEGARLTDGAMDDVFLTQIKELAHRQSEGLSGHLLGVSWLKSEYPAHCGFALLMTSSPQRQRTKTEIALLIDCLSQRTGITQDMDNHGEGNKAICRSEQSQKKAMLVHLITVKSAM